MGEKSYKSNNKTICGVNDAIVLDKYYVWVLFTRLTEWITDYHCHKENLYPKWYVPDTKI